MPTKSSIYIFDNFYKIYKINLLSLDLYKPEN